MLSKRRTAVVALLTLLLLAIPLWPALQTAGHCMDEGMLLVYPELLLKGKLPYRDFETFYGPLNLCVLAGAYSVASVSVFVERAVGCLYHLAILLGLFMLARRGGLIAAVASAVLAELFLRMANVHALAWNGGVACVIWAVQALSGMNRWRAAFGGFLGAAALLYRPDLGPAVILSAAPYAWRFAPRERWTYLIAFALGLVPLLGFAWLAGFANTFNNLFLYPVVLANAGRRIPFAFAAEWTQGAFCLHLGACVCNILVGIGALKKNLPGGRVLLAAALLALGMTHQAMQRMDGLHIATTVFASIAILPWSLVTLARYLKGGTMRSGYSWACAGFVLCLVSVISFPVVSMYGQNATEGVTGSASPGIMVKAGGREFPVESVRRARQFNATLEFLERHAAPGERLFVGGRDLRRAYANDTVLYHLASWLEPATYFLEMNPLSANRPDSRLADDLANADWLVLDRFWDLIKEPNESRRLGPNQPNEVVANQFQRIAQSGWITIYRKRASVSESASVTAR